MNRKGAYLNYRPASWITSRSFYYLLFRKIDDDSNNTMPDKHTRRSAAIGLLFRTDAFEGPLDRRLSRLHSANLGRLKTKQNKNFYSSQSGELTARWSGRPKTEIHSNEGRAAMIFQTLGRHRRRVVHTGPRRKQFAMRLSKFELFRFAEMCSRLE